MVVVFRRGIAAVIDLVSIRSRVSSQSTDSNIYVSQKVIGFWGIFWESPHGTQVRLNTASKGARHYSGHDRVVWCTTWWRHANGCWCRRQGRISLEARKRKISLVYNQRLRGGSVSRSRTHIDYPRPNKPYWAWCYIRVSTLVCCRTFGRFGTLQN